MDNLGQMRNALQTDLVVNDDSSLYSPTKLDLALNRAYTKIGALYRWAELEDAKRTSTKANQEYYDYPENWQPDSIWKLTIDGTDYGDPLAFKDYLYEKEQNRPSGLDKMWSNQWRRFFVYPTPTTNGTNNVNVWGQKVVILMVNNNDTTIFSYSMREVNDAIVMEAKEILKSPDDSQDQGMLSPGAVQIVTSTWNKIRENQSKQEKTQPMFEVPDFFKRKNSNSRTGDFN